MENYLHLFKAVIVIVVLYLLAIMMRRRGALTENHSLLLARIVTDLCLPAVVFVSLAGMPPAFLGVVFLRRHGGEASLASALLLAASLVSTFTLLIVFRFVG